MSGKQGYITCIEHKPIDGGGHQYTVFLQPGTNCSWAEILASVDFIAYSDLSPITCVQLQTAEGESRSLTDFDKVFKQRFSEMQVLTSSEGNMLCIQGISKALGCVTMITWISRISAVWITTEQALSGDQIRSYAEAVVSKRFDLAPDTGEKDLSLFPSSCHFYIENCVLRNGNYCRGTVIIPSNATSIGNSAFGDCEKLTKIIIPDSVTSIGCGAFRGCKGLADKDGFVIVRGVLYDYFGNGGDVVIPDNVTCISYGAFGGCAHLTGITIPGSVTSIDDDAFDGCINLKSIAIPDGVTNIGRSMFEGCTALTRTTIPDSVTSIGKEAFSECKSLTSITIPDSVTSIGDYAFKECENLTGVTVQNSVTSFGKEAFRGCKGLADKDGFVIVCGILYDYFGNGGDIVIPNNVTSISEYAFSRCNSLTGVILPDSVTSICNYAFEYCINLASITIPDSVTSIDEWAFDWCMKLSHITISKQLKATLEERRLKRMFTDGIKCSDSLSGIFWRRLFNEWQGLFNE